MFQIKTSELIVSIETISTEIKRAFPSYSVAKFQSWCLPINTLFFLISMLRRPLCEMFAWKCSLPDFESMWKKLPHNRAFATANKESESNRKIARSRRPISLIDASARYWHRRTIVVPGTAFACLSALNRLQFRLIESLLGKQVLV